MNRGLKKYILLENITNQRDHHGEDEKNSDSDKDNLLGAQSSCFISGKFFLLFLLLSHNFVLVNYSSWVLIE